MRRFIIAVAALVVGLPALARAADTYTADPVHCSIIFRVRHLDVSWFWGRINSPTGSFTLDEAEPEKSTMQFALEIKDINTGNPKRDEHLRSPDFFNAAQFPTITFKSTAVKKAGDHYEVTGDLTLLGVTKSITVSVEKSGEGKTQAGQRAGIETSFTIKRSDFGMNKMVGAVGDEVKLFLSIEGEKK